MNNNETQYSLCDVSQLIGMVIGVLSLIIFFTVFGYFSTRTSMPSNIRNSTIDTEKVDYQADKDSNHGQDPKIIYGKGNQLKRMTMPSEYKNTSAEQE